jgi:hypothetical protein
MLSVALVLVASACTRSPPAAVPAFPDWSGVWELESGSEAAADAAGATDLHLTPAFRKLQLDAKQRHGEGNMSTCLPAGATAILQHGVLFEFLITPGRVTMLFEDGEVRRIHTDGRQHLALEDLKQSFMGDSVGHWEGHVLTVETIGFPKGELWQNYGVRATLQTRLTERMQRQPDGRLQIESEMTDPAIFTQPYRYTRTYIQSELPLTEPVCAQNNRDTGTTMDLTPPSEE